MLKNAMYMRVRREEGNINYGKKWGCEGERKGEREGLARGGIRGKKKIRREVEKTKEAKITG